MNNRPKRSIHILHFTFFITLTLLIKIILCVALLFWFLFFNFVPLSIKCASYTRLYKAINNDAWIVGKKSAICTSYSAISSFNEAITNFIAPNSVNSWTLPSSCSITLPEYYSSNWYFKKAFASCLTDKSIGCSYSLEEGKHGYCLPL